jgi:hypothetical protein
VTKKRAKKGRNPLSQAKRGKAKAKEQEQAQQMHLKLILLANLMLISSLKLKQLILIPEA